MYTKLNCSEYYTILREILRWNFIRIFTARKQSLRRLCFYRMTAFCRGGGWWYPSMPCWWYPSMPCRSPGGVVSWGLAWEVSRPEPRGEVEGSGLGGSPGPHPGGKLRGLAHTWGSPGPHPGSLQVHTWGGIPACTEADTPPADGYCCVRYASYWNAFFFECISRTRRIISH